MGAFGRLSRSSDKVCVCVCEVLFRDRDRDGDVSVFLFTALRMSTRADSGRRNQKGLVMGERFCMQLFVFVLKGSAVPGASSSSGNGAVAGGTSISSRLSSCSWWSKFSLAALDVSGDAIWGATSSTMSFPLPPFSLELLLRLVVLLRPVATFLLLAFLVPAIALFLPDTLRFSTMGFVHGFFQPLSNGPLSAAVIMTGGRPRRYRDAMASILRRFAALCAGSSYSAGGSSMRSSGSTWKASKSSPRFK